MRDIRRKLSGVRYFWRRLRLVLAIFVTLSSPLYVTAKDQCRRVFAHIKLNQPSLLQQCGGSCYLEATVRSLQSIIRKSLGKQVYISREYFVLQVLIVRLESISDQFKLKEINPQGDSKMGPLDYLSNEAESLKLLSEKSNKRGLQYDAKKINSKIIVSGGLESLLDHLYGLKPLLKDSMSPAQVYKESREMNKHLDYVELRLNSLKSALRKLEHSSETSLEIINKEKLLVNEHLKETLVYIHNKLLKLEQNNFFKKGPYYQQFNTKTYSIKFEPKSLGTEDLILDQSFENLVKKSVRDKVDIYLTYLSVVEYLVRHGKYKGHLVLPKDKSQFFDKDTYANKNNAYHAVVIVGYQLHENGRIKNLKLRTSWGASRVSHSEKVITMPLDYLLEYGLEYITVELP
ncbi:MAG: hypothetical protein HOO06_03395 [Bdellovibrionaceae bacterium]|jgi:hypothetical protein|nr:hypothetical protein [Pseudobdellovibrionaceae bacterium]